MSLVEFANGVIVDAQQPSDVTPLTSGDFWVFEHNAVIVPALLHVSVVHALLSLQKAASCPTLQTQPAVVHSVVELYVHDL